MGVPQNGWFIIYGKSKSKMDDDWVYINMENTCSFPRKMIYMILHESWFVDV